MLASATEGEEGSVPPRRLDDEYASKVCSSTVSAPAALYRAPETAVAASCTSSPPSALTSSEGITLVGAWQPSRGESLRTPTRFRRICLVSARLTHPRSPRWGKRGRQVCVGITERRLIAARFSPLCDSGGPGWRRSAARCGSPRSTCRRESQAGVTPLRACAVHKAGNWLILADCSNAFNNLVNITAVLAGVATYLPSLTPFAAKCYVPRETTVVCILSDGFRGHRTVACSIGIQQRSPAGPAIFRIMLQPWFFRGERRRGSLRCLGDTTLDLVLVTAKAAGRAIPFLR